MTPVKWRIIKHRYGITQQEWEAMYEAQGGTCPLCGRAVRLVVDHCHESGDVRGLLCNYCNTALAAMENTEWRARAEEYLFQKVGC